MYPADTAPSHSRYRRGFNLVEAAIVLGVVGLVIGGIWTAAASISESRKQNRLMEQISFVSEQLRSSYKNMPISLPQYFADGPVGGSVSIYKNAWSAFLPPDMIGTPSTPVSPWGTRIDLVLNSNHIYWSIQLPVSACITLAPRINALMRGNLMRFGGGATDPFVTSYAETADISTPSLASAQCSYEQESYGATGIAIQIIR